MPRKGRRRSGCGSWAKLAARPCQSPGPSGIPALLLSRPSLTSDLQGLAPPAAANPGLTFRHHRAGHSVARSCSTHCPNHLRARVN